MDITLIISTVVLTAVLPISVAVLYAILRRHTQLLPRSAIDSAIVVRFDSVAERDAFHDHHDAVAAAHEATLLARYRQEMERQLPDVDPRRSEALRRALELTSGSESPRAEADGAAGVEDETRSAPEPAVRARITRWCARRPMLRDAGTAS